MNEFETAKKFFLEGVHLLEENNFQAAETRFGRSLELIPNRLSTLNNLSAVKIRLKKFAEAEEFALKAVAVDDKSPEAWSNLGIARAATDRHEQALEAYDRAISRNSAYAWAWLNKAMTLLQLKRYEDALMACDQALKSNPSHEVYYTRGLVLKELNRIDEAKENYAKSLELRVASSPVFIADRRATQKAEILIISQYPRLDASLRSFEALQLGCANYPAQLARFFKSDFHFTFVFDDDAFRPSARNKIPQPHIVLNNCVSGEVIRLEGTLAELVDLVDSFHVPVVNHPAKVVKNTRDATARLLAGTPGILVPKTMRFSTVGKTPEDLMREIEDQYDYPFITRTLAAQEGKGMTKVDSRDSLASVLSSGLPGMFLVTQFVDSRGGNEFFRKIRAVAVKDEIIITRVDYSNVWNVRGRKSEKRVPFYLENKHLLDEERRICLDPEGTLGQSALQTLKAVRERIPLDAFGIDFEIDRNGLLVFYEANANMNLFSTAQKEVPNPKEAEERLKQAFNRYFMSLVARG